MSYNLAGDSVPPSPLSTKQQRFVDEYTLDHNGSAAAVRAGYAPGSTAVTASRLLRNAKVVAAVEVKQREAERSLEVSRQKVLAELQAAIEIARGKGDPMAMISGWREIAKICGYYAPERRKVEVSSDGRATLRRLEAMSDAELLALAAPAID